MDQLPKETLAAVSMARPVSLAADWRKGPLGDLESDARLAPLQEPIVRWFRERAGHFQTYWGVSARDIQEALPGKVACFFTFLEWASADVYEYDLCLLAESGGENERLRALIEKMLQKAPVDARRSRYEYRGETIYSVAFNVEIPAAPPEVDAKTGKTVRETPRPGSALALVEETPIVIQYAFIGRYVAVCEGRREPVRLIIDALKDPARRLSANAEFRRLGEELGEPGQIQLWANAGGLWRAQLKRIQLSQPKKDLSGLGLQDIGGLRGAFAVTPRFIRLRSALGLPDPLKGCLQYFLKSSGDNSLKSAELCPPAVQSYSSQLVDGQALWSGIRSVLLQFAPAGWAALQFQIKQLNEKLGTDIERGIIGAIGGELVVYQREIQPQRGRGNRMSHQGAVTFLLGLREGASFNKNATRLLQALQAEPYNLPIEKTAYLNNTIWTLKQSPGVEFLAKPGWAITDSWLMASSDSEELPGLLRAWSGKGGRSLAQNPAFRAARNQYPAEGLCGFSFTNAQALPGALHPVLLGVSRAARETLDEDFSFSPAPLDAPAREALGRRVGAAHSALSIRPKILSVQFQLDAVNPSGVESGSGEAKAAHAPTPPNAAVPAGATAAPSPATP